MEPTTNDGYISYLEARLDLLEKELRKQGVSVTPTSILENRLQGLQVGCVISWFHRYPRGDVYKFVAFKQKSNEWRIVHGSTKRSFPTSILVEHYGNLSLEGFKVLS